jgi:PKD repeat protein
MTFDTSCGTGAPAGFRLDAATGYVAWTPTATGTFDVCLNATNSFGNDSYQFQVVVSDASGITAPIAQISATPVQGPAPLLVAFDASASSVDPAATLLGYLWDFGDGWPWMTGTTSSNRYLLPGGVNATLTVYDSFGQSGTAVAGIRVQDSAGHIPPLARIVASQTSGADTLGVDLSCNCQPGDAPIDTYLWDFGDSTEAGATVSHTFTPGRYHVRLTVIDQNKLTGTDMVEIAVTQGTLQPPQCRTFAMPPADVVPFETRHRATYVDADGTVSSAVLTFADGTTTTAVETSRSYPAPGSFGARLRVTDNDGLLCTDMVQVTALSTAPAAPLPPRFLSAPQRAASCGINWQYSASGPSVSGAGPFQWSLENPSGGTFPPGMQVDPATGQVTWLPTKDDKGLHSAVLLVQGSGGVSRQLIEVDVACGPPNNLDAACGGCSSAGAFPTLALLALVALLSRGVRAQRRSAGERAARGR